MTYYNVCIAANPHIAYGQCVPRFADFLAGGAGGPVYDRSASLGCLLANSNDDHGPLMRVAIFSWMPFMLIVAIGTIWVFIAYWTHESPSSRMHFIVRHWAVTLFSVLYVSYIDMTTNMIRIFRCIDVDSADEMCPECVAATSTYWVEHTDVECYKGDHLKLLLGAGVPLILAIVGMPLWLLVVFTLNTDDEGRVCAPAYGFLYNSYRTGRQHWEIVVLLRKALLFAITSFGNSLKANLQAILAMAVLLLSLALHSLHAPFVKNIDGPEGFKSLLSLNTLESLSLSTSILFFLAGLLFNDPNTSGWAKVAISVFLILAFLGTLVLILRQLWQEVADIIDIFVEKHGIDGCKNVNLLMKMRLVVIHKVKTRCSGTERKQQCTSSTGEVA